MRSIALSVLLLTAASAHSDAVRDELLKYCETEHPGDFELQEYCLRKQIEAHNSLAAFQAANPEGTIGHQILAKCIEHWPDRELVDYCVGKQVEAAKRLGKM